MARPKKEGSVKRLPTLQIPVSPEFKRKVEFLALASNVSVKDLLLPVIEEFVKGNMWKINRYQGLVDAGVTKMICNSESTFDAPPSPVDAPKKTRKKPAKVETPAPDDETPADIKAGEDNAEN